MVKTNRSKNPEMNCNMKNRKQQAREKIQNKMNRQALSHVKEPPKKIDYPNDYSKLSNAHKFKADIQLLKDGINSYMNQGIHHHTNKSYCFNVFKRIIDDKYVDKLMLQKKVFEKSMERAKKRCLHFSIKIRSTLSLLESIHYDMETIFNYTGDKKKFLTAAETQIKDIKESLTVGDGEKIEFSINPEVSYLNQHYESSLETEFEIIDNVSLNPDYFTGKLSNFASGIPSNSELSSQYQPHMSKEQSPPKNLLKTELSSLGFLALNSDTEKVSNQLELQKLNKAKEEVVHLMGKLKKEQDDLEAARTEMNEKINNVHESADSEQKKMAVQLTEIREMLRDKLSSTNQIAPVFENCLKGVTCQGILWDIRWLVEEGVQQKLGTEVTDSEMAPNYVKVTQNEVHLVILIAFLLKIFPFSVSTEFIYSYIRNVDAEMSQQDVENLLNKFPAVFRGECFDVKPLEKKWRYLNFSPVITI